MKENKEISKGYNSVDKMFEDLKQTYFVNVYLLNGKEHKSAYHKTEEDALKSMRNSLVKKFYVRTEEVVKNNEARP